MHIPQSPSQTIDVLDYADALLLSGRGGDYDASKWLYIPDFYTEYRYVLGTRGRRPLVCVGVNPSTAAPDALDNTLKSVSRIASANGYDSFLMLNVYAQRATRPQDMDRERDERLHRANMDAFRALLSDLDRAEPPSVWAAWGAVIEKRPYLADCVRDMAAIGREYGVRWLCAGKRTNKGHPHHPLYLRKDEATVDFDIEKYLEDSL